jgi:hypothetical protein
MSRCGEKKAFETSVYSEEDIYSMFFLSVNCIPADCVTGHVAVESGYK